MKKYNVLIKENDIKNFYSYYFESHDFDKWADNEYPDNYEFIHSGWDIPHYSIWQDFIYERLGDSFILTPENCKKITDIKGIIDFKIINNKKYKFYIEYTDEFDIKSFNTLMNFYGYSIDINISKDGRHALMAETVQPEELKKYDFTYTYYITNHNSWDKIQKEGLIPKQKGNHHIDWVNMDKTPLEYPGRIYMFSPGVSDFTLKSFAHKANILNGRKENDTVLLKIDLKGLNERTGKYAGRIRLFTDPAYNVNTAMFTMEPVPKEYITRISFNEKDN